VTRDIKPTRDAIRLAVEEFGSIAHLARAIGVSRDEVLSWLAGACEMPLAKYEEMLETVASQRCTRK